VLFRIREPRRKKTPVEEHWEKFGSFGLTSVEQETHEKYFYNTEHWNYFTNDEDLGPVILSLKQENINGRDQFRYISKKSLRNLFMLWLCSVDKPSFHAEL
jgi:hypothetical protein